LEVPLTTKLNEFEGFEGFEGFERGFNAGLVPVLVARLPTAPAPTPTCRAVRTSAGSRVGALRSIVSGASGAGIRSLGVVHRSWEDRRRASQIHSNPLETGHLLLQRNQCAELGGIGKPQTLRSKCLKSLKSLKSLVGIWFGPNRFFQSGNSSLTLKNVGSQRVEGIFRRDKACQNAQALLEKKSQRIFSWISETKKLHASAAEQ